MALSAEEKERIAREHLAALEAKEAAKARKARLDAASAEDRERQAEQFRREEQVRRIKAEVEEAFYSDRGYVKYTNHRGRVLWLTPEEYRIRKTRTGRRRHKKSLLSVGTRYRQGLLYLLVAIIALAVGAYLAK